MPGRTVVVAPNWVGDTVLALPVLEALHASGREIEVLARPHLHPLLGLVSSVARCVEKSPSDGTTIANLRRGRYEEAVILPNSFRSAWLPLRAGIPSRRGYTGRLRGALLGPGGVRQPPGKRHQVQDYCALLETMGIAVDVDALPHLALSPTRLERGREFLTRAGIESNEHPVIGLFPGAEFGPSKRWPWKRFAELARELRKEHPRARLALIAGPKELWMAVRIHEASGAIHPVIGPDLDLADLATAISRLDLLITNDSGPMHLAASLKVPCVALFGPTDPRRTRPCGSQHQVISVDRWCSPCFRKRCPLLHHRCLRDIQVEKVAATCAGFLNR